MPLFFFSFFSEYSGQPLYDGLILTCFNLFFTSLPPFANGILEKDAHEDALLAAPIEYGRFRDHHKFSLRRFIKWTIGGVAQSFFIYFFAHALYYGGGVVGSDGRTTGLWTFGAWICTSTIIVTNLSFYLLTMYVNTFSTMSAFLFLTSSFRRNKTRATTLSCLLGVIIYLGGLGTYCWILALSPDLYGLTNYLYAPALSYLYQIITTFFCVL